jgi:hypothetical protein
MKPRAPELTPETAEASLHAEIMRLCEAKASEAHETVPAPPSEESLRAATPLPSGSVQDFRDAPTEPPPSHDAITTPAPPPTSQVMASQEDDEDFTRTRRTTRPAIPPPPRLPKIADG